MNELLGRKDQDQDQDSDDEDDSEEGECIDTLQNVALTDFDI